jgi:hypothetical protein
LNPQDIDDAIRAAIAAALVATKAFDDVITTGLKDLGDRGAENLAVVAIMPMVGTESDEWDDCATGRLIIDARCKLIFVVRDQEETCRDNRVSALFSTAQNALNGNSFGGYTMPFKTRFQSWNWEEPTPPERKLTAILNYRYDVPNWTGFPTSPGD